MKLSEIELKQKVKNISQSEERTFQEILKTLCLERFLVRLSQSKQSNHFVLKGGNLLRYYISIGRQTMDLDFLLKKVQAKREAVQSAFEEVCSIKTEDGFEMNLQRLENLDQNHMSYPGFRVVIAIKLIKGKFRDNLQVDVGFGDKVSPRNQKIPLMKYKGQPFYEASVLLQTYPIESIYAEKLETISRKGGNNSRIKDFHDLVLLSRNSDLISKQKLAKNIKTTFSHRNTEQDFPLRFTEDEYSSLNKYWSAHIATMSVWWSENHMPEHIKQAILEINNFISNIPIKK